MWYAADNNARPTACGDRVNTHMDDYPTIFSVAKYGTNSKTGQTNYLTGVRRGIGFVTTLVASRAAGVQPLRFFYWNYQMSIDFTPNYSDPDAVWPFHWNVNRANLGDVHTGASGSVPLFTTPSPPYNAVRTSQVIERP
jgi:hypothetical protein